jgi:hypothetical protein
VSFRRRTYPEVLDNLLTATTGGVSAEPHPFPPPAAGPPFRHSLLRPPVSDIVSVYGSRAGQPHLFRKGADYQLLPDGQTLEWLVAGATLPDAGTLVEVSYYPRSSRPALDDVHVGSVVRTISESIALEIARLYAQLETVYQAAFVDTASGSALDNVVALLGIRRVAGGRPVGEIEFRRAAGTRGAITLPHGTRVTTVDGNVEYETTQTVTLAEAQPVIRVAARDVEENKPLPAGVLTVLPVPIAGIAEVTNPAPTQVAARGETDAELRDRAKSFLHGSERATLGALRHAVSRQGVTADVDEVAQTPGLVEITPHSATMSPELQQRLLAAIDDARPAGVRVVLRGAQPPRKVNLELRVTSRQGLLESDLRAAQRSVRERIEDYFTRLPVKEPGSISRLVGLVLSVPEIEDMRLLSATWTANGTSENVLNRETGQLAVGGFPTTLGDLHIADPNLPTAVSVVVTHPAEQPPADSVAIREALTGTLTYLNAVNQTELTSSASDSERATRELTFEKLLSTVPLPGNPATSLEAFDTAAGGVAPPLPGPADVAPYAVQFVFTLESGLSHIVASPGDSYRLTPFERLSLQSVEVAAEPPNGNV